MALNEHDRADLEEKFLEELEREFALRETRRDRRRRRAPRKEDRQEEIALLKYDLRAQFYKDRGYILYTDSRGQTQYMHPDDAERRSRRNKRRRRSIWKSGRTDYRVAAIVIIAAIVVGLVLVGR